MTDPIRAALEQAANELDIAENALLCSSFHNAASRAKQAAMTARAAIAADRAQRHPQPVPVSEWRTIDTAPKDGTEILASDYDAVKILSWRKGRFELGIPGEWISRDGQAFFPTWWQPLADHPALPLPGEVEHG